MSKEKQDLEQYREYLKVKFGSKGTQSLQEIAERYATTHTKLTDDEELIEAWDAEDTGEPTRFEQETVNAVPKVKSLYQAVKNLFPEASDEEIRLAVERLVVKGVPSRVKTAFKNFHSKNPDAVMTVDDYHNKFRLGKNTCHKIAWELMLEGFLQCDTTGKNNLGNYIHLYKKAE